MRLIPLSREARKTRRRREETATTRGDITRWFALGLLYWAVVFLTSTFLFYTPPVPDEEARLNVANVRAWTDFSFVTEEARRAWEQEREKSYRRVWRYDEEALGVVLGDLMRLHEFAAGLDSDADPEELARQFRAFDNRLSLTPERARLLAELLPKPFILDLIEDVVSAGYRERLLTDRQPFLYISQVRDDVALTEALPLRFANEDQLAEVVIPAEYQRDSWRPIINEVTPSDLRTRGITSDEASEVLETFLGSMLRPNLRFDAEETERRKQRFPRGDLAELFEQGQPLLASSATGRELTREEVRLLEAHADAVEQTHRRRLLGHMIFVAIVFVILSFYVRKFSRDVAFSTHNVILISLPVLLGLGVQCFCILLADGRAGEVGYLFPAGAMGMLGVLLLDVRMALLLVTWGCLLFGLQVNLEWDFVIVGLFGGYTAVAAIYTIRKRYEVFVASILIGLTNAAVIMVLWVVEQRDVFPLVDIGMGLTAGVASFLVLAILPVIERFGIITDVQLLELTGLQNPLLRQLEELAPGTWQHTLNVAKLAEAAATEIGVNYLMVRAGCYYHDIGKMKKPQYFTENQLTNEEKQLHNELKPIMSAFIIKNHVKEGVEMAKAAGLPPRIIDFITQHHGTSLITYFYHKALEQQARGDLKETVRDEDYRYPWQKPQSIETAIVMLADSVEATATAKLSNRTVREEDIQQVVRTTIFDKFNDGQFDECNLTLRDLNTIREVFVKVLKSRFHTRIDYPKRPGTGKPAKKKGAAAADESGRGKGITREEIQRPTVKEETA